MKCKKCGSENVNVQAVTHIKNKHKGIMYWLFIGWWLEMFLWLFLTIPKLIFELFKPNRIKSKTHSEAVCQDCGYRWII
ncbi:hypothetical protein NE172_04815 [Clostridium botulinum]|uniref:Uncharacterized protein n=1 Tax=Clostridium botulinum TaxID=1491 RepID=A0A6B4JJC7_CLOBO|nr:hypothetical protein [Clostridium botulinum]EES48493.1 hypothetical protein CLO_1334 [Clostridium botulinum E1 str. 'BoNT E Beluga']MBY6760482.1 hypothetical protein [Clostridium botulinum]MBY6919389.1 hypothetical protein [Clostridium botulinum]MCR1130267.1 hypothetical protein [Clostridium botulinum]NFJ56971.1 hypothetical protein [Clostridium botulinum]